MYAWIVIINYILFYVFDLIDYIENHNLDNFQNTTLLLSLWAIPAIVTISFTGTFIDYYPTIVKKLVFISLLGSPLSLLIVLYALLTFNSSLMSMATIFLGFFVGILIISGQTLYSISTPLKNRNKSYSLVIAGVSLISILSIALFDNFSKEGRFFAPLLIVSILGLFFLMIFYFFSRQFVLTWKNDEWRTKSIKIYTRPSVIVYFWSHTLIWVMLGLMIGSLAQVQKASTLKLLQDLFSISPYKGFWIVVLLGSMIAVFPVGILSDRFGRKTIIIFCTTGIVLASLVVAIFDQFLISTLIIGFSFACVHAFSSLWVDLASRDAIGRYNSLNFQSLGLGFLIGFLVSFYIYLNLSPNFLEINIFFMLGLAMFANLPLFWISDSYPPLEFFLLIVTNNSGMPLFHYNFKNDEALKVDLALVSGALTALNSFMIEATGEDSGRLSLVRHGTHFIISEENESGLTAAIFSNKNDPELQQLLKKFLKKFQLKYKDQITAWRGNTNTFDIAINDAEELFGHLISIKT